jgi:hypothetical protein
MLSTALLVAASLLGQVEQESALPDAFRDVSTYFVGDWASEVELEGKVYRGTWTVKWSTSKACLVSYYEADTPEGPTAGTRVQGWDAASKKMLVIDFAKDGSSFIERYELGDDGIDRGKISGVNGKGERSKATARTVRTESDLFTWTVTEKGKPQRAFTFRRKK